MGRQAKIKVKRRREEQKRNRLRHRAYDAFDDTARTASAKLVETYETAGTADRRALEARVADIAEAAGADPRRVLGAINLARRIAAAPIGRGGMSGSAVADGEFPHLRARLEAALDAINRTVPAACPHLTPDSPVAAICVDEPGEAMCQDCQDVHFADAHPSEWNHTCLECGGVDLRGISPVMPTPLVGLPVRFGDEARPFLSPVVITGLGMCNPCRLAAGRKRKIAGGAR